MAKPTTLNVKSVTIEAFRELLALVPPGTTMHLGEPPRSDEPSAPKGPLLTILVWCEKPDGVSEWVDKQNEKEALKKQSTGDRHMNPEGAFMDLATKIQGMVENIPRDKLPSVLGILQRVLMKTATVEELSSLLALVPPDTIIDLEPVTFTATIDAKSAYPTP